MILSLTRQDVRFYLHVICPLLGFGLGGVGRRFSYRERDRNSRRGGKVGISRVGRDFQGVVGTGGNLFSVFAGFHSSVFSTALLGVCEWPALIIESSHHMRAIAQRHPPVQMLVNRHRTTS